MKFVAKRDKNKHINDQYAHFGHSAESLENAGKRSKMQALSANVWPYYGLIKFFIIKPTT
jgi:hypothetical protein